MFVQFDCSLRTLVATILTSYCVLLRHAAADTCPSPQRPSTTTPSSISTPAIILDLQQQRPAKQCPDFKDDAEQSACCPSQINQGNYYCCTHVQKEELESTMAAEARRRFIGRWVFRATITSKNVSVCQTGPML